MTALAVRLLVLAAASALSACASGLSTRTATASQLDTVLAGNHRAPANRARDVYRHPRQTLLFFGVRPEMTLVEIAPNPGWYTEVLAPLLRERGRYVAALPATSATEINEREVTQLNQLKSTHPALYDRIEYAPFVPGQPIVPDGTADMVVTFRNIHNWMGRSAAEQAFASMFRALKPGGVLGVVEHRGNPQVAQDPRARSGYVNQTYAIRLIEGAGFRLVATSEINANSKDTKDYPRGVWTLPPLLLEGAKDRDRYVAIGESDRFTLKFVKPRK
ncbi:MAG: methyltransferase domain-containing protein [Steroidobacteraceae bacterium]